MFSVYLVKLTPEKADLKISQNRVKGVQRVANLVALIFFNDFLSFSVSLMYFLLQMCLFVEHYFLQLLTTLFLVTPAK